jgi:hypothetical protein
MSRRVNTKKESVRDASKSKLDKDVNPEITSRLVDLIVSEFKLNDTVSEIIAKRIIPISKIISMTYQ